MPPIPSAPFRSSILAIEAGWIDYNGHLNQAYYGVLFDRAIDEVLLSAGLGPDYVATRNLTFMAVEAHNCFVREAMQTDPVRVAALVLGVGDKRLHLYCELEHATDGWLSATSEWLFLHVDLATRRTAPWPADVRERLEAMKGASLLLPWPERAGRRIVMPGKV